MNLYLELDLPFLLTQTSTSGSVVSPTIGLSFSNCKLVITFEICEEFKDEALLKENCKSDVSDKESEEIFTLSAVFDLYITVRVVFDGLFRLD